MDFSQLPNSSFNDESWLYNNNSNSELKSSYNNETLQEPVPFEDFKFSFGMNPDFAGTTADLHDFSPAIMDPFLQEPFNFMTPATHTVLDENDQKAFSSFLDAFFMDPDMQFQQQTNQSNQQQQGNTQDFYTQFNEALPQAKEDEEEYRRSSILQSLDEQKMLHQRLNLIASLPTAKHTSSSSPTAADHSRVRSPSINNTTGSVTSMSEDDNTPQSIYLRQSDSISSPYTNSNSSVSHYNHDNHNSKKRSSSQLYSYEKSNKSTNDNSNSNSSSSNKKARTNKELLTEEEKRANHIASEQKRRSTIRNGFKDLTDLIPTLKNINNSKSTVLFKAVEFIRYLEKRNKGLRDKVGSLELRVEVEGRMTQTTTNSNIAAYNNKQLFDTKSNDTIAVEEENKLANEKRTLSTITTTASNPLQFSAEQPAKLNAIKHVTYENSRSITSTNTPTTTMNHQKQQNNNMFNKKSSIPTIPLPFSSLFNGNKSTASTQQHQQKRRRGSSGNGSNSCINNSNSNNSHLQGLPANARNALLSHKTQQKQLLILQEQLQMHQRLIAQQQKMKERSVMSSSSSVKNKLPPILGKYNTSSSSSRHNNKSSLLKELEDKAISAP